MQHLRRLHLIYYTMFIASLFGFKSTYAFIQIPSMVLRILSNGLKYITWPVIIFLMHLSAIYSKASSFLFS